MRAIGQAEVALELMCKRSLNRVAFGKPIAQLGANYDIIAESRMEIEQARLLCLKAAWMMDKGDAKAAAPWISQIKVVAPRVALKVVDESIQMFGGQGISQDTPLAAAANGSRNVIFDILSIFPTTAVRQLLFRPSSIAHSTSLLFAHLAIIKLLGSIPNS